MQCKACGFDDKTKQGRKTWEPELGFIEIEGHFTTITEGDGYSRNRIEVSIYACPVCGTLRKG